DVGDVAGAVDVQVDGVGALAREVLDDPDEVTGVAGDAGREQPGAGLAEGAVELVGVLRGQGGGALGAGPADDDLGPLDRAGDGGAVGQLVVLAVEAGPLPRLGVPETGENRELLLQTVE